MAVYYKFKSAKDFDSVSLDGHFITVASLKDKIFQNKHLGSGTDFDLVVSNAQTNEGWFIGLIFLDFTTFVVYWCVRSLRECLFLDVIFD